MLLCVASVDAWAQHDPGRNAVRLLADGKLDEAATEARKGQRRQNSPLDNAEREFVFTMIACKGGDVDAALAHARAAVKLGLPFERLLAGPRDVLAPLYKSQAFGQWRQTQKITRPLHGPLLGAVTDTSARFWVRTASPAEVRIELAPVGDRDFSNAIRSEPVKTPARHDHTAVVSVADLHAATIYHYRVLVNDRPVNHSAMFKTRPTPDTPETHGAAGKYRIAFGGGAGYTHAKERMWNTLADQKLDALLLLGDNVYIDHPESQITQRYCYYRRHSRPEWRNLVASVPVYSIYDDHDFAVNDCIPGPKIDTPAWKREVWTVFKQNWNNPSYGGGEKQPGCWYNFHLGDVHFVMLDCRYYRDLKGGSMLGAVQKRWLFQTLRQNKSKATFTVIASSVPWSHDTKGGSKDTWDGYPEEREEIFAFVEAQRIDGMILIAADRHRSDIWKTPRPNGYDLYEFQSSKLTNVHVHPIIKSTGKSRMLFGYNKTCSFGRIDFDTTRPDPLVTFTIIDIEGREVHTMQVASSQLSRSVN